MRMNRRDLLKFSLSSLAYYSTAATTPNWIARTAEALPEEDSFDNRILVIIQQSGGNDGLNTVIPRTDDIYYDAQTRPNIQLPRGLEITLDSLNGFHPQLFRLADWFQKGNVCVVNNVGYLNPNQSHFTSTDIYEYGMNPLKPPLPQGWVARYYDNQCRGCEPQSLDMVVAGKTSVPDSLAGYAYYTPPAINQASDYALAAHQDNPLRLQAIEELNQIPSSDFTLDFIQRSANVAQQSVKDVDQAAQLPMLVPDGSYTGDSLGRGLKLVSQIIRAGYNTRIFYVSHSGYDTHAGEVNPESPADQGVHPRLLGQFDQNLDAFLTEMEMTGNLDRVLLMTFSEFGRRVKENGSNGTDHGAANCLFVLGGGLQGGIYGGQPDLSDLDHGNLRFKIDFRSVYAQVIESWFGRPSAPIFGLNVYDEWIVRDLPKLAFIKNSAKG